MQSAQQALAADPAHRGAQVMLASCYLARLGPGDLTLAEVLPADAQKTTCSCTYGDIGHTMVLAYAKIGCHAVVRVQVKRVQACQRYCCCFVDTITL